ncbi:MAG: CPBP family intramembrane glutamic endopeptidase [Thermoanaerobaculia bacterium]|nr:CPBP family intramembrane glutamic endopeptidase [Thermoanaerobaculia bacterium]
MLELLRLYGPPVLAVLGALAVDRVSEARGLTPPGFRTGWRRGIAGAILAGIFWMTIFFPLSQVGVAPPIDLESVHRLELFGVHGLLLLALLAWFLLGYAGVETEEGPIPLLGRQLGMTSRSPARELGVGLVAGLSTWPMLLVVVSLTLVILVSLGAEEVIPREPPELVVWIAALPVGWKLAIAASAGLVEELFFRGFLQPRVGIALSTLLFVLAHTTYDQPFMLVGITLLSLLFAGLVWWRQNVWSAVFAHFLFDAVQLLFVIPWALKSSGGSGMELLGSL